MSDRDFHARTSAAALCGLSVLCGLLAAWNSRGVGSRQNDRPRFEPAPTPAVVPHSAPQPLATYREPASGASRCPVGPEDLAAIRRLASSAGDWQPTATDANPRYPQMPRWARRPNETAPPLPADEDDLLVLEQPAPPIKRPTEDDDDLLVPEEVPAKPSAPPQPEAAAPPQPELAPKDDDDLLVPDRPNLPARQPAPAVPDDDDLLGPATPPALQPPVLRNGPPPQSPPPVRLPPTVAEEPAAEAPKPTEPDPHIALFAKNNYPSARDCAPCHQQHFEEWSVSSHAYACVSPMFHKFEQRINELAQGTIGYFCLRCHSPAGVAMGMERDTPLGEMPHVAREGVTCIVCHRVNQRYFKTNGERHIVTGPLSDPIYGTIGGQGVAEALSKPDHYKVKTVDDKTPGQVIHREGKFFEQLGKSEFCASCHQVAVHPGIKLEVVYEQYRASPACKKGVQCQECHMGKVPGLPEGYNCGPAAIVNGKAVNPSRKHSNHLFHGPGYSIAHPGIFPHNVKADRWSPDQWLAFDWRAGWGVKEFEDELASGRLRAQFPPVWKEADDRLDAREILDANFKLLAIKRQNREQVMENGSKLEGPFFPEPPTTGRDLRFNFVMTNTNTGHNLLTASLGAQPQMWINVALTGPNGMKLWESGYTDSYGDLADIHSEDVRQKKLAFDAQLFNLQTMFLITGVKGADREFPLPVNVDFDQLPFIRPGAQPISVLNHPPFIRMEARSLAPLGSRPANYVVPASLMQQPGQYRLTYRVRSRVEPIYFMRFCKTTAEQQRSMNEGILDIHRHSVTFTVR